MSDDPETRRRKAKDASVEDVPAAPPGPPEKLGRLAVAGFVGTAIEFFDFHLYGIAAAMVFGELFFPQLAPGAGTLASIATFAVAFVARPVGAVLFGHIGDRIGRKATLSLTLLLTGLSTVAVGLLPGYNTIGIAAPILLIALRFIQGIGVGGEWAGAVLLTTEHAPPGNRGRYAGFVQLGPTSGELLAIGSMLLLATFLPSDAFVQWAWRIPFIASSVMIAIGLYVRLRVAESPMFTDVVTTGARARVPLTELMRNALRPLLVATGLLVPIYALVYLVGTFLLAYGQEDLGLSREALLTCLLIADVGVLVVIPLAATLSDRVGRRPIIAAGIAFAVLWAWPLFSFVETKDPILITLGFAGGKLAFALIYAPLGAFVPELFSTRFRYSGAGLSYNLGGVLGGALVPIAAVELTSRSGSTWPVALLLVAVCASALVCLSMLAETRNINMSADYVIGSPAASPRITVALAKADMPAPPPAPRQPLDPQV